MALENDDLLIVQRPETSIHYKVKVSDFHQGDVNGPYLSLKVDAGAQEVLSLDQTRYHGNIVVGDKIDGGTQNAVGIELSRMKGTVHIRPAGNGKSALEVLAHGNPDSSRFKVMGSGDVYIGMQLMGDISAQERGIELYPNGNATFNGTITGDGGIDCGEYATE